jgi:hypothetical protein
MDIQQNDTRSDLITARFRDALAEAYHAGRADGLLDQAINDIGGVTDTVPSSDESKPDVNRAASRRATLGDIWDIEISHQFLTSDNAREHIFNREVERINRDLKEQDLPELSDAEKRLVEEALDDAWRKGFEDFTESHESGFNDWDYYNPWADSADPNPPEKTAEEIEREGQLDIIRERWEELRDVTRSVREAIGIPEKADKVHKVGKSREHLIKQIRDVFKDAQRQASPIILDLDGTGINTVGFDSDVYFDHDGNGFAQLTGWVGANDGLLVWDRD